MDIYKQNNRWKLLLGIAALLIVATSVIYSYYLVRNVAEDEKTKISNYKMALEYMSYTDSLDAIYPGFSAGLDYEMFFSIIAANRAPTIIIDESGETISGNNYGAEKDNDEKFLRERLKIIQRSGAKPMIVKSRYTTQYIFYENSWLLTLLRYYPFIMAFLVVAFVALGYMGFSSSRNAEQSRVWAGMAKETAHQLGTPLSGIIAWLEHLKLMRGEDEETMEIVDEIGKDVVRLELIADRFSKIGSEPELKEENVMAILKDSFDYMKRRAPKRLVFELENETEPKMVSLNKPLFEWVLENLLRNALDASDGKGKISGTVTDDNDYVYIDISDTGKGIPESKFKTIFRPGFSTKKRGWGLGLSLTKRIIESYHSGKIFVKESVVGEGTTFRIRLPKN